MFKKIFGDIATGQLLRLPYLGYSVLLFVLMAAFMISIGLMIGGVEQMMGGDIHQAQDKLRGWLTLPFMIIFAVVMAAFLFAGFNIMAKRIRNIGLPGWWSILVILVVGALVTAFVSQQAGNGLNTLIWLALLLIPAKTFSK